jgi:hypothetical protein
MTLSGQSEPAAVPACRRAEMVGGKSRLVTEFVTTVADGALVLAGGCVEVSGGGLPYAPFTAVLRELVRARGAAEVAALLPGQNAGELARLPQLGTPPPSGDPEMTRARLFEHMLMLLEALAEQRPLILVVGALVGNAGRSTWRSAPIAEPEPLSLAPSSSGFTMWAPSCTMSSPYGNKVASQRNGTDRRGALHRGFQ